MAKKDIIVVGSSAGGLKTLMELVKQLPASFPASFFIVQHISPAAPSYIPQILNKNSAIECLHPKDGQKLEKGKIYIAPPDHHLIIEKNTVLVKKGPKENRFRPSIDALFRSAAYNYGTRAIGIVLSGLLDDGTSGLWNIKRLGGTTIVQSPEDALYPDMPVNALEYVEADYILPVAEIGTTLGRLVSEEALKPPAISKEDIGRIATELRIASQTMNTDMLSLKLGEPSNLTCPECNGTLSRIEEKKIVRYRCHTGHAFTENVLLSDVKQGIEDDLWKAIRGLDESILILEDMAARAANDVEAPVKTLQQKIRVSKKHSLAIRETLNSHEQFSADKLSNNNKTGVRKVSAVKKKRKS